MPYHLQHTQLRVLRKYVHQQRNRESLQQSRLIVLEHILPTTAEFLAQLSEAGAEIFQIIAKPYSVDQQTYDRLAMAFPTELKTYAELETTDYLDELLANAVSKDT